MIKKVMPFLVLTAIVFFFFWQSISKGLLPLPSDTIVGLYHPYRDLYSKDYPNGIPYKNFLITDPVRQQYPWKSIVSEELKKFNLPLWNLYSFSGTPLLANFQSSVFYPLNILFILMPFNAGWFIYVLLQPLLAGFFMFIYLRNLKISELPSFFGSLVFSFSAFFSMWLEWGNVLHTALWLPLVLLAIDKIKERVEAKENYPGWIAVLSLSLILSFFGGHLQTFFYLCLLSIFYSLLRLYELRSSKFLISLLLSFAVFVIASSVQLVPTLKFILLSARNIDQIAWQSEGWFIPAWHLIQLVIPDFFGNPSTLNYWGTWNYGELTAYIGLIPLIFAIYAVLTRKTRIITFFLIVTLGSLLLSLSSPLSEIPYKLGIPFISTSQPTRLIFLINFSLAVLSAIGMNEITKSKNLKLSFIPLILISLVFITVGLFIILGMPKLELPSETANIVSRNTFLPLMILIVSLILIPSVVKIKQYKSLLVIVLISITVLDLFRFSWKFNTFSKSEYLYPDTATIKFLKENADGFRIATNDSRILPPNFSGMHGVASVEGYDPLFTERYAELISAINRNQPDISSPFGFNRIVRISNFSSPIVDSMGIKYVLSFNEMDINKFKKVFEEGTTKVYENRNVLPKVYLVPEVIKVNTKQEAIARMFDADFDPSKTAIIEGNIHPLDYGLGEAEILEYQPNIIKIRIKTDGEKGAFMVLSDSFYPTWRAKIDNGQDIDIYRTNYNFRGVAVPSGEHTVVFYNTLL